MKKRWRLAVLLVVGSLVTLSSSVSAAPTEPTVTFLAAGDFSASPEAQAVLTKIGQDTSDLTLALGDFSYGVTGQEQAWCDLVTSKVGAGYPFELISGNHESRGNLNGNVNDFSSCLPNQLPGLVGTYGRQYYVDVPKGAPLFRYIMISPSLGFPDGTYSYPVGSARYDWTAKAIDNARAAGIPWVVVGMHKPCISMGEYACDPGADLFNLLVSKKVDLVLGGHEHMYQRSKQLALTGACTAIVPGTYNAACVAGGGSALSKGAGLVQITVGTGGVPFRDVALADTEKDYFVTAEAANQNPTHGYLKVSATASQLNANFVGTDGVFTDAFSITAGPPPVNQTPVANFTSSCTDATCTLNGSTSIDPDGTIASYGWDFGDGTTGSGVTPPAHVYAAPGVYPVTLTVTDNAGATATVTNNVTANAAPVNQPPVASFAAGCNGLVCTFNGGGSSDPDGTIASYSWTFGEGPAGSGATAGHTYTAAGTYPVVLTVTDNAGATASSTQSVTVSAPAGPTYFARDDFNRTVASGFGTATLGGAWSTATNSSVAGGTGVFTLPTGADRTVRLDGASAAAVDLRASVTADKPITNGLYYSFIARRVGGVGEYRGNVKLTTSGAVQASIARTPTTGAEVTLAAAVNVAGLTVVPGDKLNVRVLVTGSTSATIQLKVWKDGTAEPTAWARTATDSTAGMQVAGSTGFRVYLSSTSTNPPVTVRLDDWLAAVPS